MELVVSAATGVILVAMLIILVRALLGPTVHDRILSVNIMGTKAVILLALLGALHGRSGFLDIAILYGLINFMATIAFLKFKELRRLG